MNMNPYRSRCEKYFLKKLLQSVPDNLPQNYATVGNAI